MTQAVEKKEFGDKSFLRRMTLATAWGEGLDGFDLGIIAAVLLIIQTDLQMTAVESGLLAASTLIGIFFGAPIAGVLSDRFGRKRLFLIDICLFVVLGLAQAFVTEFWQLFLIRVLLGIAIGAEYSIGSSMLSEFVPAHGRGRRVSYMLVYWYGGFLAAVALGIFLENVVGMSWHWILATGTIPALVVLALRVGLPESPRWLMLHGRRDEARVIIDKYLGGEEHMKEANYDDDTRGEGGWKQLFGPALRSRTFFACAFYVCVVTPYFAIATYAEPLFGQLGIQGEFGLLVSNSMAFFGAIVGMLTIEHLGRRQQLIIPFWITGAALVVVALWTGAPPAAIVAGFAVFAFFNAVAGNLTAVYPIELFPTEVRGTGVGFVNAVSRIGAAAGTFLLPVGIEAIGLTACLLIAAGLCVAGAVVSQLMAPETTGKSLSATGGFTPITPRASTA